MTIWRGEGLEGGGGVCVGRSVKNDRAPTEKRGKMVAAQKAAAYGKQGGGEMPSNFRAVLGVAHNGVQKHLMAHYCIGISVNQGIHWKLPGYDSVARSCTHKTKQTRRIAFGPGWVAIVARSNVLVPPQAASPPTPLQPTRPPWGSPRSCPQRLYGIWGDLYQSPGATNCTAGGRRSGPSL